MKKVTSICKKVPHQLFQTKKTQEAKKKAHESIGYENGKWKRPSSW